VKDSDVNNFFPKKKKKIVNCVSKNLNFFCMDGKIWGEGVLGFFKEKIFEKNLEIENNFPKKGGLTPKTPP